MIAPLRVGVVGVGYLGRIHAKIYASMPDVELVGVADVDASAAERIAAQHGCAAFTDSYALVDIVDAVSIAVPTSVHAEVAMPYLDAGVHMLLEKPIAPSVEEAERIVEAADRSEVRLLIGHLERFNAGIMALADRVTDPRFIEVHRLGTFVERATDVDVVTDLMIHDIDIVLSLVKSELSYVSAVGSAVLTNHVDIANARLEFANNTVANVTASRVSSKKFRRIFPGLATETVDVTPRPPLDAELEHFIATVRNGAEPLVNGREGLKALRVAEQVQQKIKACLR
jgi:predicted dehydrogenase